MIFTLFLCAAPALYAMETPNTIDTLSYADMLKTIACGQFSYDEKEKKVSSWSGINFSLEELYNAAAWYDKLGEFAALQAPAWHAWLITLDLAPIRLFYSHLSDDPEALLLLAKNDINEAICAHYGTSATSRKKYCSALATIILTERYGLLGDAFNAIVKHRRNLCESLLARSVTADLLTSPDNILRDE